MLKLTFSAAAFSALLSASLLFTQPMAAEPTGFPEFSLQATDAEPVLLGSAATIHSRILEEDRTFLMRVPPKARKNSEAPVDLTVIYILDAEKHFASAAASAAFFEAYAALDPSLWWDQGKLAEFARQHGAAGAKSLAKPPQLYAAFASKPRKENTFHLSEGKRFQEETAVTLEKEGIRTQVRFFPDEVHGTVAPPAIFDALKVLFPAENVQKPSPQ